MNIRLLSCDAAKPDKRAITKMLEEIGEGVSNYDAQDFTEYLLEGDPVEISVSDKNSSSGIRALRKLGIDYEMVD
ncbi:MAG: hypothetical protein P8H42_02680 [Saprospiraceae bacterium]|jgi:hypothetical protein|nr:hypothetical protein [Saprospiraceae bacterium]HCV50681.1 hypothetical protein [Saprospirales bacterium]